MSKLSRVIFLKTKTLDEPAPKGGQQEFKATNGGNNFLNQTIV